MLKKHKYTQYYYFVWDVTEPEYACVNFTYYSQQNRENVHDGNRKPESFLRTAL